MTVLSGPALGVPDMEPVRGFVADALEAVLLNKGLHQVHGMAVFLDPVLSETPHDPAQEMAGQMRHPHPGQDEEAGIIGHEGEVGGSCVRLPADQGVARGGFPCGGTEEETGQILTGAISNQVLEMFTDRSGESEVMMVVQVISQATGFGGMGGWNMNGQGRQGVERRGERRGVGRQKILWERGEEAASTGDTNRWQSQKPALFEFVDQAAGGKGFQLPSMGLPAPVPANMLSELMTAPVRVLGNQIVQPGKIRWEDVPTLTSNRFIHDPDYAMGGVVSPGKSGYRKMA